jgi:excisionase family DNA binding protein
VKLIDEAIRAAVRDELRAVIDAEVLPLLRHFATPRPETPAIERPDKRYISAKAAARLAGVCDETVRNWIRQGRLRRYNAGRMLRVDSDELAQFLATGAGPAAGIDIASRAMELLTGI